MVDKLLLGQRQAWVVVSAIVGAAVMVVPGGHDCAMFRVSHACFVMKKQDWDYVNYRAYQSSGISYNFLSNFDFKT